MAGLSLHAPPCMGLSSHCLRHSHHELLPVFPPPPLPQVSVSREEGNVTFSRSGLAQFLINVARRRFPDKLSFSFEADCRGLDLAAKKVRCTPANEGCIAPHLTTYLLHTSQSPPPLKNLS